MNSNLIFYDIDNFLDKYTRFMTKDIYISYNMYNCFLRQYEYLYQLLDTNRFLYNDNLKYKKMMDINKNRVNLLKLHNQKYLKNAVKREQSFFIDNGFDKELDINKKKIILSNEDNMLVIQDKNVELLVLAKIKYLLDKGDYSSGDILVLTKNLDNKNKIIDKFGEIPVKVRTVKEYGISLLSENEKVLTDDLKYSLFSNYLIDELFLKKDEFRDFYNAFSKYIYLNKDYSDYETFRDYHNYMYKRKFLSSNLSLKEFNQEEIKRRKNYLMTINNEVVKTKSEVDIANFLYLNSISYDYNYDDSSFFITLGDKKDIIYFSLEKESLEKKKNNCFIMLYSAYYDKKSFLEVLVYELIKRRYPLELVDDKCLYNKLKEGSIDNYFSEFIRNYLIPIINYYEENNNLEISKLNDRQREKIYKLYDYYKDKLDNNNYLREKDLMTRIKKDILDNNYKYLVMVGDIAIDLNISKLIINSDYKESELVKENIKLLYDYKNYLSCNKSLPVIHTYLDYDEINYLTSKFLKDNLAVINNVLEKNKKEVDIVYYDDSNRLHIYKNIGKCCNDIIDNNSDNLLVAFKNLKDMKLLIGSQLFYKRDNKTLYNNSKKIVYCEEITNLDKLYDTIVLPYLIVDSFHEDILISDYDYYIKVMLYVVLSKCRKKVVLLCPKSKKKEITTLLKSLI